MPLRAQRLNDCVRDRLATALALRAVSIDVAVDAPRIPIFLHKGRATVERITALRTEEMTRMPLRTTRHHDLPLNGRLATLTPRAEALMEVQMAVESRTLIDSVLLLEPCHSLRGVPARQERNVLAALAGTDAFAPRGVLCGWLRVEGDAFELLATLVAAETFGVEAASAGADDATRDGECAVRALRAGADGCWSPMGAGG